jgi:hypothetical protein
VRRLDESFAGFEAWAEQVEQAEAEDARRLDVRWSANSTGWNAASPAAAPATRAAAAA